MLMMLIPEKSPNVPPKCNILIKIITCKNFRIKKIFSISLTNIGQSICKCHSFSSLNLGNSLGINLKIDYCQVIDSLNTQIHFIVTFSIDNFFKMSDESWWHLIVIYIVFYSSIQKCFIKGGN